MRRSFAARLLLPALMAASCAPQPERQLDLAASPSDSPRANPAADELAVASHSAPGGMVRLSGARGETLSFQLRLDDVPADLDSMDLETSPLSGPDGELGADCVTAFRAHPARVPTWPGWHLKYVAPQDRVRYPADVLVPIGAPRGGLSHLREFEREIQLWVDVTLPASAAPGRYSGQLTLRGAKCRPLSVPLEVTVWPFALPALENGRLMAWIDYAALLDEARRHVGGNGPGAGVQGSMSSEQDARRGEGSSSGAAAPSSIHEQADELLSRCARLLMQHGITPLVRGVHPKAKMDANGRLSVNWTDYDRVVGPSLDGARVDGSAVVALPVDAEFPPRGDPSTIGSAAYLDVFRQAVAVAAKHFEELGLLDRAFVALPPGDSRCAADVDAMIKLGSACRRADDRVRVASSMFPQELPLASGVSLEALPEAQRNRRAWPVDIWVPSAQFFDATTMHDEREQGRRTWMRLDRPPFSGTLSLAGSEADRRAIAWQAQRLGAAWVDLGTVGSCVSWIDGAITTLTSVSASEAGDGRISEAGDVMPLLYSGAPFGLVEPVPSARLKELRRGLQDVAYLSLLKERGLDHVADAMLRSLTPLVGADACNTSYADGVRPSWPSDPRIWEAARQIMAEEILRHDGAATGDPLPSDIRWRRFMQATRALNVSVEGVSLRPVADGGTGLSAAVAITNQRRLPVVADLRFDAMPMGWKADPTTRRLGPLGAGQRQRLALTGRLSDVPVLTDGLTSLPLSLTSDDGWSVKGKARVACVTAAPTTTPIRLDGALDDWPVAAENVAGDFRLVSADPSSADDAAGRPRHATTVYLARDAATLYIACKCSTTSSPATGARGNTVRYDDGVPRGDNLIELLFDPVRDGSRSPDCLFHIILMRSGAHVTERGARIEGAPAPGPWAPELRWVLVERADGWAAELALPLSAFDDAPRWRGSTEPVHRAMWGFNVTRWEPTDDEFSTWSGASNNVYDPATLGNLFLP